MPRSPAFAAFQVQAGSDQTLAFYDPAELYDPSESTNALALTSHPFGNSFGNTRSAPAEARPQLWPIPESVYFLYRSHRPDGRPSRQPPVGTAFILNVSGRSRNIRFLVTARHVVDPEWAHCSDQNPDAIDLRLNRRSGGVGYETLSLRSGAAHHFYTPLDSTADIAVIPLDQSLIPNLNEYKFIDVPFQLLLTDSEKHLIHSEQQVMTARPSSRPIGEGNNFPVFDGGVVAKMADETISVHCTLSQATKLQVRTQPRMLHVWFIDAGFAQGVSGAPVYTSIARGLGTAEERVLLGVQSVAWPDEGMAGITPSPVLGDLIRSAMLDRRFNFDLSASQTNSRRAPPLY